MMFARFAYIIARYVLNFLFFCFIYLPAGVHGVTQLSDIINNNISIGYGVLGDDRR